MLLKKRNRAMYIILIVVVCTFTMNMFQSNQIIAHQESEINIVLNDNPKHILFSYIPKQKMITFRDIVLSEGDWFTGCSFRGKVFVLGVSKTGTTTMRSILHSTFGYKCSQKPIASCRYYGLEHYYKRGGMLPLLVAPDDISWLFHSKSLYNDFMETVRKSTAFMDAPWPFLYPIYDQILPPNYSKFILLIRNSTRDVVNSNMKMYVRRWKRYWEKNKLKNTSLQYDYSNFSLLTHNEKKFGVFVSWEEFWMLIARQYELHNQNVIQYFTQRDRLHDLLIINLGIESQKMPYSEQWYKITKFLGCANITDESLPQKNIANDEQIDFFPKDYQIEWRNYKWSDIVSNILNVVHEMNGKYNETLWNVLKTMYEQIRK
eukprot:530097_1